MIEALAMEFQKIRRRKIWVIVAALIFTQLLWLLWEVHSMRARELSVGWICVLYHFSLLNAIMMPVIAAVVESRLCDLEHKGQMFKLLYTVMPAKRLFTAKFLCGALYMFAAVVLQLTIMIAVGFAQGFEAKLPMNKFLYYLMFTTAVNLTILLLQQVLSLLFKNQMVPLTVGIIGCFAGLFSMFFPENIERLFLWGYYGVLMFVGMNWDSKTRIAEYYYTPVNWGGFGALVIMFCVIYIIGSTLFARKEM
jgi:hypothetical protein